MRHERVKTTIAKPLFDEAAERAVVGACLFDAALFWNLNGRLEPRHFSTARLAKIWEAMISLGNAGQPIAREQIAKAIKNDDKADTPLPIFLSLLLKDTPDGETARTLAEDVLRHAQRRAALEALDACRAEVMGMEFETSIEDLQERMLSRITGIGGDGFDRHMRTYGQWAQTVFERTSAAMNKADAKVGLEPGLRAVQEVMGRLMPERVYVLAGMSSSGKSALARQIVESCAAQAAQQGLGWAYVASLEMSGDENATRALSERLGIAASVIEECSLDDDQLYRMGQAFHDLKHMQIMVDTKPRMRMEDIRNRALRLKHQKGLSLIAVDHLLLIKPEGRADSLMDRVANASSEAKFMAREFNVPVLLLAQLNEKAIVERPSGRPNGADLFGGQAIMQNADIIAFVHRQEIVEKRREPSKSDEQKHARWSTMMANLAGKACIFNDKRRGGARHTSRDMTFRAETMTFEDL